MKIVVCIKQVPDSATVRFDREKGTLIREGVEAVINPHDLHALEAGLALRDQVGGEVTVITMGPPQAEDALRECVSRGADHAVLLSDRAFAGADTLATTYVLAKAIEKIGGVDLVLCGKLTSDGDTAQVGPGLAARLGLPYCTCVGAMEFDGSRGRFRVTRVFDDREDVVELGIPCLFTVESGINTVRVPSLKGKMRAKKMEIPVWGGDELGAEPGRLGLQGSPTRVHETWVPEGRGERHEITGDVDEQVAAIVEVMRETGVL